MNNAPRPNGETRPWAPLRAGVPVERRGSRPVFHHGARAGLLAGVALGLVEVAVNAILRGNPWIPFDFAAAIVVGPDALAPRFPVAASVALGLTIHFVLSVTFGVIFLAGLALTFQLSARAPLMLLYGAVFGLAVWEVDFLVVLPTIAPELKGSLDVVTQVVNGIASYVLIFGPVLAGYVIRLRPGVLDRWWITHPDAS